MKTIKQIADELGIDKQKVYRYIKKNHINEANQEQGVMYYDEAAQNILKSHFDKNITLEKSLASTPVDVLLKHSEILEKELEIKNEQIKELNARLAESNAALLSAQQSAHAAQALHAGTIQKQLTDDQTDFVQDDKPKSFFSRFFSR